MNNKLLQKLMELTEEEQVALLGLIESGALDKEQKETKAEEVTTKPLDIEHGQADNTDENLPKDIKEFLRKKKEILDSYGISSDTYKKDAENMLKEVKDEIDRKSELAHILWEKLHAYEQTEQFKSKLEYWLNIAKKYARDEGYAKVLLGIKSYNDYLNETPLLKVNIALNRLIKYLYNYRGFARSGYVTLRQSFTFRALYTAIQTNSPIDKSVIAEDIREATGESILNLDTHRVNSLLKVLTEGVEKTELLPKLLNRMLNNYSAEQCAFMILKVPGYKGKIEMLSHAHERLSKHTEYFNSLKALLRQIGSQKALKVFYYLTEQNSADLQLEQLIDKEAVEKGKAVRDMRKMIAEIREHIISTVLKCCGVEAIRDRRQLYQLEFTHAQEQDIRTQLTKYFSNITDEEIKNALLKSLEYIIGHHGTLVMLAQSYRICMLSLNKKFSTPIYVLRSLEDGEKESFSCDETACIHSDDLNILNNVTEEQCTSLIESLPKSMTKYMTADSIIDDIVEIKTNDNMWPYMNNESETAKIEFIRGTIF